ncbi:MAG: hypothetical protein ACREEW_04800, partial [Caulobacteraceae bacterium]
PSPPSGSQPGSPGGEGEGRGAGNGAPAWARQLRTAAHGATTAARAVGSAEKAGGAGAHVSLSEESR